MGELIKIVSLNAWGGQCWAPLSDWLQRLDPDVLCLQEVIRAPVPSPEWLAYTDAYRHLQQRADLFADVSRLLPHHLARFAPAARGFLYDTAQQPVLSEHGLGQWVAPHLAWTTQWQGFVHGAFRHNGWGDEPVPRAIQVSKLHTKTGKPFVVAHLHGLRDPAGKGDTAARTAQWRATVQAIQSVRAPQDPVILAGDLNILPDSDAFEIFATLGLSDQITARGHIDTRTSLYKKPQRYADYILTCANTHIVDLSVPAQPEVSDHRPLILTIELT